MPEHGEARKPSRLPESLPAGGGLAPGGGVAAGARLNLSAAIPIVGGIAAFVSIGLLHRFAKELSGAAECAARFTWPPQEPKKTEEQSTAEQ